MPTETFEAEIYCDKLGIKAHKINIKINWNHEEPDDDVGISGGFDVDEDATVNEKSYGNGWIYFTESERLDIIKIIEKIQTEKRDEDEGRRQAEAEEERRES